MQKTDKETISNNNKNSYTCIGIKVIKNGIIDVNNTTGRFRGKACVMLVANQITFHVASFRYIHVYLNMKASNEYSICCGRENIARR